MSATTSDDPNIQPPFRQNPFNRWLRLGIVLAGIIFGQAVLYGPSLIGKKILLPLDILSQPNVYLPINPSLPPAPVQDATMSDLIFQFEPERRFAASELQAGRLPMWADHHYAGVPFIWPKFSPFLLLQASTPSPLILPWAQMLAAIVTGLGAYAFCRRAMGLNFWAAAIPAWCYPLTGFFVFWQGNPVCTPVFWMPWLLLAVDASVRHTSSLALVGLSIATGLTLTSGHLDVAGQVLLSSGFYGLWRIWDLNGFDLGSRVVRRAIAHLAIGWTLGFLLAMPQILPTLEYAKTGARMVRRESGIEERPPVGLAVLPQVVLPDIYGSDHYGSLSICPPKQRNLLESTAAAYTGLLATLVLAPLAWCSRRHRSQNFFFLFLAVFALSWSLDIPGFVDLLRLPGLNMMSHNRFVFAASFSFLALAAVGLDVLGRGHADRRWWPYLPLALLAGLGTWALWRSLNLPPKITTELESLIRSGGAQGWVRNLNDVHRVQQWFIDHYRQGAALCGLGVLIVLAICFGKRWQPRMQIITGLLALGDLLWFAWGRNAQCDPALYFPPVPALQNAAQMESGRIVGFGCFPPSLGVVLNLRDIRGYDAVDPFRLVDLLQRASDRQSVAYEYALTQWFVPALNVDTNKALILHPILDMLNVRYVIFRAQPNPEVQPFFQIDDYWVAISKQALPRPYVPRRVEVEPEYAVRLQKLAAGNFDPTEVAYVESPVDLPAECRGEAKIIEEIPTRIKISVKMETAGLVVLSDLWDKGWRAYLDGKVVPILRTNHAIRGVVVPAGATNLEFRYESASFAWGVRLAVFALAILIGWSAMAIWTRKSRIPLEQTSE